MKKKFQGFGAGLALTLGLSFLLCVFAPLEFYIANQSEFWMNLNQLLPKVGALFAAVFLAGVLAFLALWLLGERLFAAGLACGFAVLLALYIQGTFLAGNLPPMDGTEIDWAAASPERVKSIAVWALCLSASTALCFKLGAEKFRKVVFYGSGALTLVLVLTLSTLLLTSHLENKDLEVDTLVATTKGEFEVSSEENLLIFVLDAVDSATFQKALADNPRFMENYRDFVLYDDMLATYPYTKHAIPSILSGQYRDPDQLYEDYLTESLLQSPLLNAAEGADYSIGLYSLELMNMLDTEVFAGRYVSHLPGKLHLTYRSGISLLIKMAAVKYAPWDFKRFAYNLPDHIQSSCQNLNEDEELFSWFYSKFWPDIQSRNPITVTGGKCLRFIHLEGAHVPLDYDINMQKIENGTYQDKVEACLTVSSRYLERLKESGVYDNSTIVIMADHGYTPSEPMVLQERMHPLFMVKGRNETREGLTISSLPLSYECVSEALAGMIKGKNQGEAFAPRAAEETRRCVIYEYSDEAHVEEYTVTGHAGDISSMEPTGVAYSFLP